MDTRKRMNGHNHKSFFVSIRLGIHDYLGKKGYSLLEVLLTIVLVVVGYVSLLQILSVTLFSDVELEKHTTALFLAQEKMEEIRDSSSYAAIDDFISARLSLAGDFADFQREVTVSGDPKEVNVIVYWNVKGADQSVDLVSLFADYNY